jgi:hypothetical protein
MAFASEPTYTDSTLPATSPAALPTNAVLNIQATAGGIFKHGFSMTDAATFGAIVAKTLETGVYKTIDFTSTEAQGIGYYQIASNSRNDFSVILTAKALKSEEYISGTSVFMYVPYTLKVDGVSLAVGTAVSTTAPADATMTLFGNTVELVVHPDHLDAKENGILAESYLLEVVFPDLVDVDNGLTLPEGNYAATITVAVSAT